MQDELLPLPILPNESFFPFFCILHEESFKNTCLVPKPMVRRLGGSRRKTRYKLQKRSDEHGRVRITAFMQTFKVGDTVNLSPDSSIQRGMFHPRHIGKTGTVCGIQGKSYRVKIRDKDKMKEMIVHPVHLKKQ